MGSEENQLNCYAVSAEDEIGNIVSMTFTATSRKEAVISFGEELESLIALNANKNKNKEYVIVDIKDVPLDTKAMEIENIKVDHYNV